MPNRLKIDFVSDVSCPWCVIGLKALESALATLRNDVVADLHFQPFELNPQMGPQGQDIAEHIAQKYGSSPADMQKNRAAIRARGVELGFTFNMGSWHPRRRLPDSSKNWLNALHMRAVPHVDLPHRRLH
jgi:predicted DsbA family dithiol-disulfide isomerase